MVFKGEYQFGLSLLYFTDRYPPSLCAGEGTSGVRAQDDA